MTIFFIFGGDFFAALGSSLALEAVLALGAAFALAAGLAADFPDTVFFALGAAAFAAVFV